MKSLHAAQHCRAFRRVSETSAGPVAVALATVAAPVSSHYAGTGKMGQLPAAFPSWPQPSVMLGYSLLLQTEALLDISKPVAAF